MARFDTIPHAITEQNGRKHFIQKIAFTGTGAVTPIATTDVYGFPVPPGCCLVLQADQDFLYELRTDSGGATHVTVQSGARAGIYVPALQQEFVVLHQDQAYGTDTGIDVIAASSSGNLNVFWIS